jgi:aryl-alcohol dehydrogenase-like predicted oxidoreductase
MNNDFTHATFGKTGLNVFRFGLSASYRPGKETIYRALDEGINFFFCYGFDSHMTKALRNIPSNKRDRFIIATGAYNLIYTHQNLRRTLEKRLHQLNTEYIDTFLFLGVMKEKQFPEKLRDEICRLKEEGKVRAVGMSCHDRKFAGRLAAEGALDVFMIRYNAAHRGAEDDIFPHLAQHDPGLISYTATRWGYLIRRHKKWPKDRPVPTAGMCYRFVLTNPNVDVCLNAPSNQKQFLDNLAAVRQGALSDDEMAMMREYGDLVHGMKKWFM